MSLLHLLGIVLLLALAGCATHSPVAGSADTKPEKKITWAIAVHGGAGSFSSLTDPADIAAAKADLQKALEAGREMLAAGKSAMDTVEAVVRILEDDPRFNAGRGAVFTAEAGHELDASIMDGATLRCGAVGGVKTVKHPISLARLVMERTRHILLAGPRADDFAKEQGVEQVGQEYFFTQHRYDQLQKALERRRQEQNKQGADAADVNTPDEEKRNYYGTVGCVALDSAGNLAAATSTGGLTAKMPGRIGDSPLIGAGNYAANDTCAVSGTGVGERFIEQAIAFHVSAIMRYKGVSATEAARIVVHEKLKPGEGGVIVVGRDGSIAMPYNTDGMMRGAADSKGRFEVHLREE